MTDRDEIKRAVERGDGDLEPSMERLMAAVPDPARSLMAPIRWWRSLDAAGRSAFAGNPGLEPFLIRFGLDAPGRPRSLLETGRLVGRPPTRWSGGMESLLRSVRGAAASVASPTE